MRECVYVGKGEREVGESDRECGISTVKIVRFKRAAAAVVLLFTVPLLRNVHGDRSIHIGRENFLYGSGFCP